MTTFILFIGVVVLGVLVQQQASRLARFEMILRDLHRRVTAPLRSRCS